MITRKGIEDCVVNGNMIPKGSIVCVNIWAMGRDPNIWKNPLEFMPERFLEGEGSADEDEHCGSEWNSSTMWLSDAALEIECSSPLVVEDEEETRIVKVNVNDVEDKIFWEICMAVGYP